MTGSPADEKSELMCALEKVLDGGARETLIDVYNKTLVRTAQKIQMQHGSVCAGAQPDHIDDTMLMWMIQNKQRKRSQLLRLTKTNYEDNENKISGLWYSY